MKTCTLTRDEAFALLREYNKEAFHIQHALMRPSKSVIEAMRFFEADIAVKMEVL